MNPVKVALVGCSKSKRSYPCVAADMYLPSVLFRRTRRFVEGRFTRWFILSAKHGLLEPSDIVYPYSLALSDMGKDEASAWAERVNEQFTLINSSVSFFAGERYRKFLIPLFERRGIECSVPLRGMGIGQQLRFYNEAS